MIHRLPYQFRVRQASFSCDSPWNYGIMSNHSAGRHAETRDAAESMRTYDTLLPRGLPHVI